MRKIFLFALMIGTLFESCSTKEDVMNSNPIRRSSRLTPSFEFTLNDTDQDGIALAFAEACLNQNFIEGLQHCDQQISSPYIDIVFSADVEDETTNYGRSLLMNGATSLSNYIYGICNDNYLRLNVYVPNQNNTLVTYNADQDIYIVNALYRDALAITDNENDLYTASYKVSNGQLIESEEIISENFANNHLTFILSFRDEIVNWHHFSKGAQSYSDLLLRNAISFVGYGCMSEEEVEELLPHYYDSYSFFGRKWRIVYGKNIFQRPCDDTSKHFCKLEPMPVANIGNPEMFSDTDPYQTAWMYMDMEERTQNIFVLENPLNLDLNGYDFYMEEMDFLIDDYHILIPQQICYYNANLNALCFDIIVEQQ